MSPELIDTASGARTPLCVECGEPFVRSAAEMAARRDPALPQPARCPACRERRRTERNERLLATYAAGPVGPRRPPAPGPDAASGRCLHATVCTACGRDIRVPFPPRPDRPLYCRPCFDARHGR